MTLMVDLFTKGNKQNTSNEIIINYVHNVQ